MARMKLGAAVSSLPQLLGTGRIAFDFDGIPLVAERLSWRRRANLLRAGLDAALGRTRLRALPPVVQVEPTNACNLACPLCPTGAGILPRPRGAMAWETFETLLAETGDEAIAYYLYGFGEPFLHPELLRMVEASARRGVLTLTTTNGHYVRTEEEALAVVDAGLTTLLVALDGATQETYAAYRQGGDVERVKRCVSLLREARDRRGARHPYLAVRSVVNRQNEQDLPEIERLARDLGADMFTCKSLGCLSHGEEYGSFEPERRELRRFEHDGEGRRRRGAFRCEFPFRQPTVFWDGTVVGCEYDHERERAFGKVGERPFRELWNGGNARALRREVRRARGGAGFCGDCPYQDRVQDGSDLYRREFESPAARFGRT
jgi:MoaA/NifB/PqqE/SkfB family radical SAM enzyme